MKKSNASVQTHKLASTCKHRRHIALTLVILTGFVLLLGSGCAKTKAQTYDKPASVAVRISPATTQNLAQRISYIGTVHSRREVKILAQTAGAVLALTPEGERVRKGDTVARITAPEIAARSSRMEAEVKRAQAERHFLCESYETDRKLGTAGVITNRQVDMSKKACDAATAAVSAAQAGSREVDANRAKGTEQASFDGLVLQWLVEPGQNVMPGMPLLLLGNHDLELRIQVTERDLERGVREGIPAVVHLGQDTERLQIERIAPMATGPSRSFEVIVALPDGLKSTSTHGRSARVDFLVAESENAIAVSEKALSKQNGEDAVFVIEDGRARAVKVVTGIRDRGLIEVKGEIAEAAWVAVNHLDLLQNDTPVFAVHTTHVDEVQP